jgi:signal peptidase II
MSAKSKSIWIIAIVLLVLIIDQSLKIWIKTHLVLGESIPVTGWFQLLFVENQGMAFGMELVGKLFLTLFRVIASAAIIYFIYKLIKENYRFGFVICVALILAGAIGNLIDSALYGIIFSHSYGQVATLFPVQGGYASCLYGKVVDMFYFPLIRNNMGETIFFRPVFNFADSAVTVGVAISLIFFRKDLNHSLESKKKSKETNDEK